jgi:hypothetical protein
MNMRSIKRTALAAVAALAVTTALAGTTLAETTTPPQAPNAARGRGAAMSGATMNGGARGGGMLGVMGRMGGPESSLVAVAANVFGIEQAALVAELNTGKTIADVAAAKGVSADKIASAYLAPRLERMSQSVKDGRMTQASYDTMAASMKANVEAQIKAKFDPRGAGDGTGVCDGTCETDGSQPHARGGRWSDK